MARKRQGWNPYALLLGGFLSLSILGMAWWWRSVAEELVEKIVERTDKLEVNVVD